MGEGVGQVVGRQCVARTEGESLHAYISHVDGISAENGDGISSCSCSMVCGKSNETLISATAPRTIQIFRNMMCPLRFDEPDFKYEKAGETLRPVEESLSIACPRSLRRFR